MAAHGPRRSSFLPRMLLVASAAAFAMVAAAATGRPEWVTTIAALYAILMSGLAILACATRDDGAATSLSPDPDVAVRRAARCAELAAAAYFWAALAMQGLYLTPLTGLKWQHGWQYALAMLLLAGASLAYLRSIPPPGASAESVSRSNALRLAVPLAALQGLVAGGGLFALVISGKLWSERADWAANRIFGALAVSILVLSAMSLASALCRAQSGKTP